MRVGLGARVVSFPSSVRVTRADVAAALLIGLGLLAIAGHVAKQPLLVAAGRLSAASPLPLVFNQIDGLEYWALRHTLTVSTSAGETVRVVAGPRAFGQLQGPHIAKMVYVFPLAVAPLLPPPVRDDLLRRALCHRGKVATELGLPRAASIRIDVAHATGRGRWTFDLVCPA